MPPLLPNSISCQDGTGEKRELSPNHEKTRRKRVKDATSVSVKDETSLLRVHGRVKSRSRSPRRNSLREEISKIKNWKDENEITKECLTQKSSASKRRGVVKFKYFDNNSCKKLDQKVSRFLAAGKKKNNGTRNQEPKIFIECKMERQSSLPADRQNKNIISDGKESSLGGFFKMGFSTSLDTEGELQAVKETRDQVSSDEAVKPQASAEQVTKSEVFAKADVTLRVDGSVELMENNINCSSFACSLMFVKDAGALARSFSLLELKVEVFTTRLGEHSNNYVGELEWEREQIRKEREAMQGPTRTMLDSN